MGTKIGPYQAINSYEKLIKPENEEIKNQAVYLAVDIFCFAYLLSYADTS